MEQTNIAYSVVQTSFISAAKQGTRRIVCLYGFLHAHRYTDVCTALCVYGLERALADIFLSMAHRMSDLWNEFIN